MKCEEYKEAIAAEPFALIDGGDEHIAVCASCRAYQAEMQTLDARIARAMAINVPEFKLPELPAIDETGSESSDESSDKVVSITSRQKRSFSMPNWLGLAAAIALAVIVSFQYLPNGGISDQELADQILAHLDHEPWAMQVSNVSVTEENITEVFSRAGGTMEEEIGLVSYAASCVINGRRIPHLVVQGKDGPITLLLMPEEIVSMPVQLDGEGVHGVILPVGEGGNGSIALIGEREFDVEELKDRVVNSVEWSI
ncbi:MAG: DUF3379 family protein [Pseudomonadales bacterium]